MKNRILGVVAIGLFVAVAAVAVYEVWPTLNPSLHYLAPLDGACDLRNDPCQSELPDGAWVSFGIEPQAIPLVQPLRLNVAVSGIEATAVEIDFSGVDMNMGYNRPQLKHLGDGRFSGEGILPVCVRDAMEWEARVLIKTEAGLLAAPYRFITVKPGVTLNDQE